MMTRNVTSTPPSAALADSDFATRAGRRGRAGPPLSCASARTCLLLTTCSPATQTSVTCSRLRNTRDATSGHTAAGSRAVTDRTPRDRPACRFRSSRCADRARGRARRPASPLRSAPARADARASAPTPLASSAASRISASRSRRSLLAAPSVPMATFTPAATSRADRRDAAAELEVRRRAMRDGRAALRRAARYPSSDRCTACTAISRSVTRCRRLEPLERPLPWRRIDRRFRRRSRAGGCGSAGRVLRRASPLARACSSLTV